MKRGRKWNKMEKENINYFLDGNMWCAVRDDFINLQESVAGFGETQELARKELESNEGKNQINQ